jgi:hypothetical protein
LASDCKLASLFNIEYIRWLVEEHLEKKQNFGYQIYTLLVLELWLREFN